MNLIENRPTVVIAIAIISLVSLFGFTSCQTYDPYGYGHTPGPGHTSGNGYPPPPPRQPNLVAPILGFGVAAATIGIAAAQSNKKRHYRHGNRHRRNKCGNYDRYDRRDYDYRDYDHHDHGHHGHHDYGHRYYR